MGCIIPLSIFHTCPRPCSFFGTVKDTGKQIPDKLYFAILFDKRALNKTRTDTIPEPYKKDKCVNKSIFCQINE
jgi:hypothetical protein